MNRLALIFFGVIGLQCTFYTDCPCDDPECACEDDGAGTGGTGAGGENGGGSSGSIGGEPVPGSWVDATGTLRGEPAGYANVCYVTSQPGTDALIAGVSQAGLWSSTNGGEDWIALGTAADSSRIDNRTSILVFDPNDSSVFWEAGNNGAGVFKTSDDGESFAQLGTVEHNDELGIDFTDPDRLTLFTSGHEQGIIYRSTNGGADWEVIGAPEEANQCSFPLVLDTQTVFLACSQWGEGVGGVFRSDDGGDTWARVSELAAWEPALVASDGSLYWATQTGDGILRSTDQGMTWTRPSTALEMVHPIELPDGKIASVSDKVVVVSEDGGGNWLRVTAALPFDPIGIAYSDSQRAFYAWHYTTELEVPSEAIVRFDYDYEAD